MNGKVIFDGRNLYETSKLAIGWTYRVHRTPYPTRRIGHDRHTTTAAERVLITGAAGFWALTSATAFVKDGFQVEAMDNLITGDMRNIEHLQGLRPISPSTSTTSRSTSTSVATSPHPALCVAGIPIDYLKIPIQTLKVGSLGVHRCLGFGQAQRRPHHHRIDQRGFTVTRKCTPARRVLGPRQHLSARVACTTKPSASKNPSPWRTTRFHGLETRIVRIFNTYGPRMRLNDGRVLHSLAKHSVVKT